MSRKLNDLNPAALAAAMRGGTEAWGQRGSAMHHVLYVEPAVGNMRRRKCRLCSCGKRITHMAAANGVGLAWGCELSVHRWVKKMGAQR